MKRDLKKIERIKNAIKKFSSFVSDRGIAEKFGVSERSVAVARRRMEIRKEPELAQKLRNKARF